MNVPDSNCGKTKSNCGIGLAQPSCHKETRLASQAHPKQSTTRRIRRISHLAVGPNSIPLNPLGIFPTNLFDRVPSLSNRNWVVLETEGGHELSVSNRLQYNSVPHYLPLISYRTTGPDRSPGPDQSPQPLFDRYVFALATDEEQSALASYTGVKRVHRVFNQARVCSDLERVHDILGKKDEVANRVAKYGYLRSGQRVRVTAGLLRGLEGVIVQQKDAGRVQLRLDGENDGATVEIESVFLSPLIA